jgi:hypothetical protein
MSLQLLAKQMEAKGRKGDSMLVHMTAKEVAALQKMAESAGGSLSVNPETGLVEANFLKRMLPTLVGVGVGMFAGPMAGAAAGAAVGGYQANRNDQDVGMGMLMGGLGGYGGASLGAGLGAAGATGTAAQAISNPALAGQVATGAGSQASMLAAQNAGFGAQGTAALAQAAGAATPSTMAPLTQGISALGKEAGRDAFMSQVGGGAGLAKTASMATAPMMAPDKAPGEVPTDDEMYVYDFDYGRTGADSMPTDSSAERRYFNPTFSNRRKIKAADYFNAAEGGEVNGAADAGGGLTGFATGGQINLQGTFDVGQGGGGQFGQANANGYQAAGGGPLQGFSSSFGQMGGSDPRAGGGLGNSASPLMGGLSGYGAAMRAHGNMGLDLSHDVQMPGSTMLGRPQGGSLQQLAAQMTPEQRAANQRQMEMTMPTYALGNPNMMVGDMRFTPEPVMPDLMFGGRSSSYATGGLMGLAKGGMKSGGFVVPADVVSMIGEGNTDAGYNRLKSMIPGATAIKGKDGGQADTVKTSIEGKQPARVAHGEMYIPPETVKRMGGAKKLYAMMDRVREQATGSKKQIKPVSLKQAMA